MKGTAGSQHGSFIFVTVPLVILLCTASAEAFGVAGSDGTTAGNHASLDRIRSNAIPFVLLQTELDISHLAIGIGPERRKCHGREAEEVFTGGEGADFAPAFCIRMISNRQGSWCKASGSVTKISPLS